MSSTRSPLGEREGAARRVVDQPRALRPVGSRVALQRVVSLVEPIRGVALEPGVEKDRVSDSVSSGCDALLHLPVRAGGRDRAGPRLDTESEAACAVALWMGRGPRDSLFGPEPPRARSAARAVREVDCSGDFGSLHLVCMRVLPTKTISCW